MLNPQYTFDSFILGDGNNFAGGAAQAVADGPAKAFNPFFIYGSTGLGKTHLLHAIGDRVLKKSKRARVTYLLCERFTEELIQAVQNRQIAKFRKKYLRTDLLLLDEVEFLVRKSPIQKEISHLFSLMHEAKKQIVLAGRLDAEALQDLEKCLVSRFEWGLVTDIEPPDAETRLAILRRKIGLLGIHVPEEIVKFLARRIHTSVRQLEEALTRIATYTGKLTTEVVKSLLRDILKQERRRNLSIEGVQYLVAKHFDIPVADMTRKRRAGSSVFPCQVAMYLCHQVNRRSLNTIGAAFGGVALDEVLQACGHVNDRKNTDAEVRQVVHYLTKELKR